MLEIPLTQGYTALVDDEDYPSLSKHKWWAWDSHPRHTYACRWMPKSKPRISIKMHHVVLCVDVKELKANNLVVDHIDRNGLNNQKANLRVTTRSVNAYNSDWSDNALGIYWDNYRGRYKACALRPSKTFIGWFETLSEAKEAVDAHYRNT